MQNGHIKCLFCCYGDKYAKIDGNIELVGKDSYTMANGSQVVLDRSVVGTQYIKFKNTNAIYIYKKNATSYSHSLIWEEDGYILTIFLQSTGNYDMLITIAESVAPIE